MKNKWFNTLNLVDEKYVSEAAPVDKTKQKKRKRMALSAIAACACLAFILCTAWLFTPYNNTPPDVSRYANSAYYGVIQKLNILTWEKPKYNNRFEKLATELSAGISYITDTKTEGSDGIIYAPEADDNDMLNGGAAGGNFPTDPDPENSESYQETTDNQVEGVIEADRIKRSDKYIYYLDKFTLRIFSIAGMDSAELGHFNLSGNQNNYTEKWAFYLSQDCKTATVVTQYYSNDKQVLVSIVALDVTDPTNIREKNRFEITGNYISSRVTEGKLLLLTEFVFEKQTIDFDDETTFLPQINTGNGFESIPSDGITLPETVLSTRYTVVIKLDENTLKPEGSAAYLSYSEDVYVSKDHLFLTHVFSDVKEDGDTKIRNAMTEVSCLAYRGDQFEKKGSATVRGYVKDQWSMDEYENILRVVTTTNATQIYESSYYGNGSVSADILITATGNSNASLYCIDLKTFAVVAKVEDFAPPREEVQSVRFDKNTAYICTSIEMSDPVFFFDLSDLENITYKDTGTIEGFSTSLVNFADGYLLGIGQSNWSTFKAEIYTETENGVEGFCQYTYNGASYSTDYKSYYIDRENRLLGLGVTDYNHHESERYILLHFDGYNLVEWLNVSLQGDNQNKRGVYIDGYMYLFGENDFQVLILLPKLKNK